jgi:hypothetical protein
MTDHNTQTLVAIPDHPPVHAWEDDLFTHGTITRDALRVHLQHCAACTQLVARLQAWRMRTRPHDSALTGEQGVDPLRARILASRAEGVRIIVPADAPTIADDEVAVTAGVPGSAGSAPARIAGAPWWRRTPLRVAATVTAFLGAGSLLRQPPAAEAGMVAGKLELMPARPRLGDTIRVTYTAAGLFGTPSTLRLRARLRTMAGTSYNRDKPGTTVAMLHRTDGNRYEGRFVLPDSVVYAALAVEDTAATAFDDFGGRGWEVLRTAADDVPFSSALDQRFHDLMGRSWEELLATARERVRLYPDSVEAWSNLHFVEKSMGLSSDSLSRVHKAQAARLSAAMLAGTLPVQPGLMYWYAATVRDTLLAGQWRTRLLRDAPTDEFAVQERAVRLYSDFTAKKDTLAALAAIERLWADTPPPRRDQVAQVALALLGPAPRYAPEMLRWTQRYRAVDSTVYRRQWYARQLATIPTLRDTAIAQLTALANELAVSNEQQRELNETRAQFAQRMTGERVLTEAILGQVLVSVGRSAEALSRLRTLPDVGWNADVFDGIAAAATAAGDTALAAPHWARLVLDPRTPTARTARLDSIGARSVGTADWDRLKQRARAEMAAAVMREARRRRVEPATVVSLDGRATSLTALANGRPMVVIMFSPLCGPAIQALPDMQQMAVRLQKQGVAVVLVAEQARADKALTAALQQAKYTGPVYLDATKQANKALNNWGTPQLYVLDRDGRVMFDPTSSTGEATLHMEALLATTSRVSAR